MAGLFMYPALDVVQSVFKKWYWDTTVPQKCFHPVAPEP